MIHIQKIQYAMQDQADVEPDGDGVLRLMSEPLVFVRVDGHPCRVAAMCGRYIDEPTMFETMAAAAMLLQGARRIVVHALDDDISLDAQDWSDLIRGHNYPHGLIMLTQTTDQADDSIADPFFSTRTIEKFPVLLSNINRFAADLFKQNINGVVTYWGKNLTKQDLHPKRRGNVLETYFDCRVKQEQT